MKMKRGSIYVGLIFALAAILAGIQAQKEKPISFSVFQDRRDNPKGPISVKGVYLPLDKEEIFVLAIKACNSSEGRKIQLPTEMPREVLEAYTASFGEFNWIVELKPVCGPTTAFINENAKTIFCFCAYE